MAALAFTNTYSIGEYGRFCVEVIPMGVSGEDKITQLIDRCINLAICAREEGHFISEGFTVFLWEHEGKIHQQVIKDLDILFETEPESGDVIPSLRFHFGVQEEVS